MKTFTALVAVLVLSACSVGQGEQGQEKPVSDSVWSQIAEYVPELASCESPPAGVSVSPFYVRCVSREEFSLFNPKEQEFIPRARVEVELKRGDVLVARRVYLVDENNQVIGVFRPWY